LAKKRKRNQFWLQVDSHDVWLPTGASLVWWFFFSCPEVKTLAADMAQDNHHRLHFPNFKIRFSALSLCPDEAPQKKKKKVILISSDKLPVNSI
jgi:hypothetical protein